MYILGTTTFFVKEMFTYSLSIKQKMTELSQMKTEYTNELKSYPPYPALGGVSPQSGSVGSALPVTTVPLAKWFKST